MVVRLFSYKEISMASQREWESVVWHFLADHLRNTSNGQIKAWIYGLEPNTVTQEARWGKAIGKVQDQLLKFAGDETCDEECEGNRKADTRWGNF